MCYNSEASGTSVYIDTSGASATENMPANVCQCSVQFYKAKKLKINSTGLSSLCGSVVEFNKTGSISMSSEKECSSYTNTSALSWPSDQMEIALHKRMPPYQADFCVSLDLGNR